MKILCALRLDGRKPFLELAKELEVSDATIHTRVKKMMEEGVIKGFETIVDDGKLGYGITAFVEVRIKPGTADEAVAKLSRIDEVLEVHEIHGHCDVLLKVRVRELTELRDKLVRGIKTVKEVVSCEAYATLKVVKEDHGLLLTPQLIGKKYD